MMSGQAIVMVVEAGALTGDPKSPQVALLITLTLSLGRILTILALDLALNSQVCLTFLPISIAIEV
jgi:hypothetical protein